MIHNIPGLQQQEVLTEVRQTAAEKYQKCWLYETRVEQVVQMRVGDPLESDWSHNAPTVTAKKPKNIV